MCDETLFSKRDFKKNQICSVMTSFYICLSLFYGILHIAIAINSFIAYVQFSRLNEKSCLNKWAQLIEVGRPHFPFLGNHTGQQNSLWQYSETGRRVFPSSFLVYKIVYRFEKWLSSLLLMKTQFCLINHACLKNMGQTRNKNIV